MKKIILLILLYLTAISLAGCGTFSVSADAISPAEATATQAARALTPTTAADPVATATNQPAPTATPEAAPTEPVAEALLPAPLYYLNPADEQVWRVEQDGETLTQISREAAPVTQYDVNPVDGSLVLLSNNSLVLTGALGEDRRVIIGGRSEEAAGVHWYLTDRVSNPVWSADGQQLAYGLNGINFYDVAQDSSRVVLPNDQMPAEGEPVRRPIHVYTPDSFSPDNAFLLLLVGWYQSGGATPAVLRLNTAAPLVELQGQGFPCCTFSWSEDGSTIFSANHTLGMLLPGLWRSDPATGETDTIVASDDGGDELQVFNWPQDIGHGQLAAFYGQGPRATYEQGQPAPMRIATVEVESGSILGTRPGEWLPGEATWLPDGSGVALTATGDPSAEGWPLVGTLVYLPYASEQAFELPVSAHMLHWGAQDG